MRRTGDLLGSCDVEPASGLRQGDLANNSTAATILRITSAILCGPIRSYLTATKTLGTAYRGS
jgi:hypothetical protein